MMQNLKSEYKERRKDVKHLAGRAYFSIIYFIHCNDNGANYVILYVLTSLRHYGCFQRADILF